jgi:protein required for attachment to host cells
VRTTLCDGPSQPAHEVEVKRFARRLNRFLQQAWAGRQYHSLLIIAPPHFLGALRSSLGSEVKERLSAVVAKDLIHLPDQQLRNRVSKFLQRDRGSRALSRARREATTA